MVLLPILLAGITITGSHAPTSSLRLESIIHRQPSPLLAAATAPAQRGSFTIGRSLGQRPPLPRRATAGHYSMATRVTAIFAGAVLGSIGGMAAGGALDKLTSNGECLTFMKYGMPIGAAIGGLLTARSIQ